MEKFKEFQGKGLDESIKEACEYFDCPRESLEIEIVQDAKSGIFGIVGARKAKIRARRAHLRDVARVILGHAPEDAKSPAREKEKTRAPRQAPAETKAPESGHCPPKEAESPEKPAPLQEILEKPAMETGEAAEKAAGKSQERSGEFFFGPEDQPEDPEGPGLPLLPLEDLDQERLESLSGEVIGRLASPIAGRPVDVSIELSQACVRARIEWQGDAGLLIGRDGQTLAAMQYLAARIISKEMGAALRVRIDIGEYRTRQEEKLRELALALAERARRAGKSFSTRPLSSYHRRIIHMSLQKEPDVQTRSSGEGPLKRVVISPRKPERQ